MRLVERRERKFSDEVNEHLQPDDVGKLLITHDKFASLSVSNFPFQSIFQCSLLSCFSILERADTDNIHNFIHNEEGNFHVGANS